MILFFFVDQIVVSLGQLAQELASHDIIEI